MLKTAFVEQSQLRADAVVPLSRGSAADVCITALPHLQGLHPGDHLPLGLH